VRSCRHRRWRPTRHSKLRRCRRRRGTAICWHGCSLLYSKAKQKGRKKRSFFACCNLKQDRFLISMIYTKAKGEEEKKILHLIYKAKRGGGKEWLEQLNVACHPAILRRQMSLHFLFPNWREPKKPRSSGDSISGMLARITMAVWEEVRYSFLHLIWLLEECIPLSCLTLCYIAFPGVYNCLLMLVICANSFWSIIVSDCCFK
jgi:hypothetical protein